MAVTNVTEISASASVDLSGRRIVRSYDVVYEVTTNDKDDGPLTVMKAQGSGLPGVLSTYSYGSEGDPTATFRGFTSCQLRSVEETYRVWRVTAKFDNAPKENDQSQDPGAEVTPLDEPTQWSGSFFTATKTTDRYEDGTPIENSAKEGKNLDIDDSRPALFVSKNYSSLDLSVLYDFRDAVNDSTFLNFFPEGTVKLNQAAWRIAYYNGTPYFPVQFEFHINLDGYAIQFRDEGYYELVDDGAGGKVRRVIRDETGLPVSTPQYLDGAGGKLAADASTVYYPATPKHVYKLRNFNLLGLPAQIGDR